MAGFHTKDFVSIVASMVNYMRATQNRITDFNVGSVARTLVEAPAAEIDQLYQQMLIGLRDAIPVSVFDGFQFEALKAMSATGLVRVTITSQAAAITIPAGTRFARSGDNVLYDSVQDTTIAAGNTYADVRIACVQAGTIGNMAAGGTFTLSPSPVGFLSGVALGAFRDGTEDETEDARRLRFQAFIASLPRGTIAAIRYGLSLVTLLDAAGNVKERVALRNIVEPWVTDALQPIGLVEVYVHNGVGSTSADLVAQTQKIIDGYTATDGTLVPGWKAAGVKVTYTAAADVTVAVTGAVTVASGYTAAMVRAAVQTAISAYVTALDIGQSCIRAEIIAAAMAVDGVTNFTLSAPASDTTATKSQKLMPGTFTLT